MEKPIGLWEYIKVAFNAKLPGMFVSPNWIMVAVFILLGMLLLATIKGKQLATIKRQVKSKGVIRKRLKFECIADQKYRPTADVLFLPIPLDFRG